MAWFYLIVAGLFEVGGVIGMNKVALKKISLHSPLCLVRLHVVLPFWH